MKSGLSRDRSSPSRLSVLIEAAAFIGLELGSHDGLDGTIGFDGEQSCVYQLA